jgi:hypothetical protein
MTNPVTWVKAHMRKKKDGIVPVRQYGKVVGFMKESAMKEMQMTYVKPKVDEKFRVAVAKLKMTKIR